MELLKLISVDVKKKLGKYGWILAGSIGSNFGSLWCFPNFVLTNLLCLGLESEVVRPIESLVGAAVI